MARPPSAAQVDMLAVLAKRGRMRVGPRGVSLAAHALVLRGLALRRHVQFIELTDAGRAYLDSLKEGR